ncbi:LysR family transcriptional regulator [Cupriavidus basilensis]|uniref:LysR family transcriptional regulator n=1 Tax=Cupriavidus basilensis TaxID=68895 RepID=UPI0023E7AB11|nr:LysR family transcriptional regulator [Cupriavidus basilensis]MDF3881118.1 LysR substrate-binding domain-containing protein [Cupriavidus basilensis]
MEISRLRALRELSTRQTMAAVADALFLTPSAVSQQIAQLEEEAGIKLTERQGRGVRLTTAGEVLVAHVERLLGVLEEAKSDLAQLKKEIAGKIRVAAFPTVAAALLPHVIKTLGVSYPFLEIVLEEMEPADGLAALGSWRADIAFVDDLTFRLRREDKTVEQVPLLEDVLYALLPCSHRFADRATVSMGELKNEAWALDSASSFYAEFIVNLCRRAGYEPRINAECRGFEILGAMVAAGCSVSVIPGLRLSHTPSDVRAVKLRPEMKRRISVAYRRGERKHPAVQVFVSQLLASAEELALRPVPQLLA